MRKAAIMDSTVPARQSFLSRFRAVSWRGMTLGGTLLAVIMGVALGQSLYTFHYAEGLSYFSSNPQSCVNCHIMQPQYDGWPFAMWPSASIAICRTISSASITPKRKWILAFQGFYSARFP